MDTEKPQQFWDRLSNEPERADRPFECFLGLPSGERTLLGAYRRRVGNPDAAKPSDTWSGWSNAVAGRGRAAAYDDHLALRTRRGVGRRRTKRSLHRLGGATPFSARPRVFVRPIRTARVGTARVGAPMHHTAPGSRL
jgi:hypothetical protein